MECIAGIRGRALKWHHLPDIYPSYREAGITYPQEELFIEIIGFFSLPGKSADKIEPGEQFGHIVPAYTTLIVDNLYRPEDLICLGLEIICRYNFRIGSLHAERGNIAGSMMANDCLQRFTAFLFMSRDCCRVCVVDMQGF